MTVDPSVSAAIAALSTHPDAGIVASAAWWAGLVARAQARPSAVVAVDPLAFTAFFEQAHLYADASVRSAFLPGLQATVDAMAQGKVLPLPPTPEPIVVSPLPVPSRPPGGAAQGYWG